MSTLELDLRGVKGFLVADVRGFGELEAAIMNRLWTRQEPATVREIRRSRGVPA